MAGNAVWTGALWACCAAVVGLALAIPPAAPAATPEPGLWIGTKGNVQGSFTVRAVGSRRVVTDMVVFCGNTGFLSEESLREPFDARVLKVKRNGVVKGWAGSGEKPVRLGRRSAVIDSFGYTSGGCPERDFKRIRVRRGPARPIQDGIYEGESDPAYHLRFEVVGGGVLLRDLSGHAAVPDPTTLTGYCGPAGAIGRDARIAADGSFTSDPGPPEGNRDSRLIVTGTIAGGGASGTYTYSAPEHCVGGGPLSGSVAFATTLTQANPHAIPPGSGGDEPEPPIETKPPPLEGYPGPPEGSTDPDCTPSLEVGPIKALAACFVTRGRESESAGRVRLNGIDLTPARPGVKIRVNRRTLAVTSNGPVELRIGGLSLLRDKLDWRRPDAVFEIDGKSDAKDPGPDFKTKNQNLFGLPVDGSAKLELTDGKTVVTVTVEVPDDVPLPGPLKRIAGYSGELRAAATNESGLVLDGGKLTFPGLRVGFVEIQGAELAISLSGSSYHFDGKATVFPFRFNRIGFEGTLGVGFGDGYFKLGLAAEQLNRALVYGFFLQKIGLELQVNPFGFGGSAGVTFGPQFRLGGDLISAARLDGSLEYLSGEGGDPSSVELAGALELAEADAADGKVTVKSDATVEAEGTFKFQVAGYGLEGKLDGWFDGLRAFNVEGGAELSIPGPNGSGDAVLSTRGVGACRHGFGPDVGFGYTWGQGIGGVSFVASSCSVGNWREERSASASQAGPLRIPVRRGLRQLAVRLTGAGGPPAVVVTAPDGRQIASVPTPDGVVDERTLLVQDPDTSATYLVVDAPARGRWTIAPQAGPPIAALATAAPLPRVRVRGGVRGAGRRKLLRYRVRGLAGRRVQLVDTAGSSHRLIRTTGRSRGRVRFTPLPRAGRHRIRAIVLGPRGVPTGITRQVATYRAHRGRPPRPRRVRIRRRGSSRIVKWRGPRRLRYEVDVRVSDGRRMRLIARRGRRSVRVGIVPRGVKVRATVRARDATGRAGPAGRARG